MTNLKKAARQACQTPLKDLLRSVPKDGRDCYEEDSTCHHFIPYGRLIHEALAEIERLEALAEQAEQEPMAWWCCVPGQDPVLLFDEPSDERYPPNYKEPLYAAPVRTKDLTDDEISDVFDSVGSWKETLFGDLPVVFARAVIAADREKNK